MPLPHRDAEADPRSPNAAPIDAGLLARARSGDPGARSSLLSRSLGLLERRVRGWIRRDSRRVEVEDVVQETLVSAGRAIGRLRAADAGSFHSWLLRIAWTRWMDHLRRDLREEPTPEPAPAAGPVPAVVVVPGVRGAEVFGHVHDLAAQERLVVILRDFLGVPWDTTTFVLARATRKAARNVHARAHGRVRDDEPLGLLGRLFGR